MLSGKEHQWQDRKQQSNNQVRRIDTIWNQLVTWVINAFDSNKSGVDDIRENKKATEDESFATADLGKRKLFDSCSSFTTSNGYVHPNLVLISNDVRMQNRKDEFDNIEQNAITNDSLTNGLDESTSNYRGIFYVANKSNGPCYIEADEILIRIPSAKTIHGQNFPSFYYKRIGDDAIHDPLSEKKDSHVNHSCDDVKNEQQQEKRFVSTWLRCLAAYYDAYCCSILQPKSTNDLANNNNFQFAAYFESLPSSYETILSWSNDEIDEYLSGTTLPLSINIDPTSNVHKYEYVDEGSNPNTIPSSKVSDTIHDATASTSVDTWKTNPNIIKDRYIHHIRPYLVQFVPLFSQLLQHLHAEQKFSVCASTQSDVELQFFSLACQVMSTRAFHMNEEHDTEIISNYTGPYLLPVIDLLNHTSDGKIKNTSLRCVRRKTVKHMKRRLETDYQISPKEATYTILQTDDTYGCTTDGNSNDVDCDNVHRCTNDGDCDNNIDDESHTDAFDFVMIAERKIYDGEEILHSYGDHLTSHEFLQTFGFVPETFIISAAFRYSTVTANVAASVSTTAKSNLSRETASSLSFIQLTKAELLFSCWDIINSGTAKVIQQSLLQNDHTIETWILQSDPITQQQRTNKIESMSHIPEIITIRVNPAISKEQELLSVPSTNSQQQEEQQQQQQQQHAPLMPVSDKNFTVLNDELVTICCLPFLPDEAYNEISDNDLLDESILEDTYLGTLVATAILNVLYTKLTQFQPISNSTLQQLGITIEGGKDDVQVNQKHDDQEMISDSHKIEPNMIVEQSKTRFHEPLTKDCTSNDDILILRKLINILSISSKQENYCTSTTGSMIKGKNNDMADSQNINNQNAMDIYKQKNLSSKQKDLVFGKSGINNDNITPSSIKQRRLAYGLTIRIDQRQVILQLYDDIIRFIYSTHL
jgi:hypothetical protein